MNAPCADPKCPYDGLNVFSHGIKCLTLQINPPTYMSWEGDLTICSWCNDKVPVAGQFQHTNDHNVEKAAVMNKNNALSMRLAQLMTHESYVNQHQSALEEMKKAFDELKDTLSKAVTTMGEMAVEIATLRERIIPKEVKRVPRSKARKRPPKPSLGEQFVEQSKTETPETPVQKSVYTFPVSRELVDDGSLGTIMGIPVYSAEVPVSTELKADDIEELRKALKKQRVREQQPAIFLPPGWYATLGGELRESFTGSDTRKAMGKAMEEIVYRTGRKDDKDK